MQHKSTLDRVEDTISRYVFESDDPIVLAVTGGWGEGKTHFWKNRIVPKFESHRPGYVSVFGADSIGAIRERVLVAAGETFDVNERSISDIVKDRFPWVRQIGHVLTGIGKHWSGVIGIPDSVVDQLMESTLLRDRWILCIDDVERLSENVGTDTFLGYVNELREEHRLKVVLIFNDDWFADEEDKSFERYREKVIDREVPFVPNLTDIIQLVASDDTLFDGESRKTLAGRCDILELTNIRVLEKAIRYYEEVRSKLPRNADTAFCDHALHSLLLFSWMKFGPEKIVTFGDLESFTVLGRSMERHARASLGEDDSEDDRVEKLLTEYNYTITDDLDVNLIAFVQDGILDADALLDEYEKHLNETSRGLLYERFHEAWKKLFHGTLRDNADEFCEELIEATEAYIQYSSVEQISSALHVIESLGKGDEAQRIFSIFLEKRPNFYRDYLDMASFSDPIRYAPMNAALDAAAKVVKRDDRSLEQVLRSAWDEEFFNQSDRERLAEFSGEEIAECLLSADEPKINSKIRGLRRKSLQGTTKEDQKIASALVDAIEIIANTSTINRIRMESMGLVKRDEPDQEG